MRIAEDKPVVLVKAKGTGPIFDVDHICGSSSPGLTNRGLKRGFRPSGRDRRGAALGGLARPMTGRRRAGAISPTNLAKKKPRISGAFSYSGGGIRTRDLRVMSPTSYLAAPPRGGPPMLATVQRSLTSRITRNGFFRPGWRTWPRPKRPAGGERGTATRREIFSGRNTLRRIANRSRSPPHRVPRPCKLRRTESRSSTSAPTRRACWSPTSPGGRVTELERRSRVTRLGRGVDLSGQLAAEAIEAVCEAVADYVAFYEEARAPRWSGDRHQRRPRRLQRRRLRRRAARALRALGPGARRRRGGAAHLPRARPPRTRPQSPDPGHRHRRRLDRADRRHRRRDRLPRLAAGRRRPPHRAPHRLRPARRRSSSRRWPTTCAARSPTAAAETARPPPAAGIAVAGTPTSLAAIELGLEPYDSERVHGHALDLPAIQHLLSQLASVPLARAPRDPRPPPRPGADDRRRGRDPGRGDARLRPRARSRSPSTTSSTERRSTPA